MGAADFSVRYGVKERTALSWQYGERLPRPSQARDLVEKSGGELTLAMIYQAAPDQPASPSIHSESGQHGQSNEEVA